MAGILQNRGQGVLTLTRIIVEASALMFVTAALLDYGVGLSRVGRRIEQLQIVPAAMALALSVLALWLAATLIFGRIYCSTVCPLGGLIDLMARARGSKRAYHHRRPAEWLRSFSLGVCLLATASALLPSQWFEPFGLYAEIITHLRHPRVSIGTLMALAALAGLGISAWRRGRLFCSTLCPVGTLLGIVARRSALRFDIDTDRCTQCRLCEHACKAECIDMQEHTVDMSRCVVCFNCLPVCPNEAITYTARRHTLSLPMMQKINTSPTSTNALCNNTLTCSPTFSQTAQSKPTAPAQEPSACLADSSASTSPTDSPCSRPKSSTSSQ